MYHPGLPRWANRGPYWTPIGVPIPCRLTHKIVGAAYHMLARGVVYRDLGDAYLDQISERRTVANLKRRLERLGYHVVLEPRAEAA